MIILCSLSRPWALWSLSILSPQNPNQCLTHSRYLNEWVTEWTEEWIHECCYLLKTAPFYPTAFSWGLSHPSLCLPTILLNPLDPSHSNCNPIVPVSAESFLLGVSFRQVFPRLWYTVIFRWYPDKCLWQFVFTFIYVQQGEGNEHIKPVIAQRIFLRMRQCHGNQPYLDLVNQGWGTIINVPSPQ